MFLRRTQFSLFPNHDELYISLISSNIYYRDFRVVLAERSRMDSNTTAGSFAAVVAVFQRFVIACVLCLHVGGELSIGNPLSRHRACRSLFSLPAFRLHFRAHFFTRSFALCLCFFFKLEQLIVNFEIFQNFQV